MPALATTPSMPPHRVAVFITASCKSDVFVTSRVKQRLGVIIPSSAPFWVSLKTVPATVAPSACASFAVASPIPEPAPVMKMVLLTSVIISYLLKNEPF